MRRTIEQDRHAIDRPVQLEAVGNDRPVPSLRGKASEYMGEVDAVARPAGLLERGMQQRTQPIDVTAHRGIVELPLQGRECPKQWVVGIYRHGSFPTFYAVKKLGEISTANGSCSRTSRASSEMIS